MDDWSHSKSWSADPSSVPDARRFVRQCLATHRHEISADEDVTLVVSELATNAVRHAGTPFSVTLASQGGTLLLTVQDASPALPGEARMTPHALGGRGLRLVEAHSAAWGVEREHAGGKSVWASFDRVIPSMSSRDRLVEG